MRLPGKAALFKAELSNIIVLNGFKLYGKEGRILKRRLNSVKLFSIFILPSLFIWVTVILISFIDGIRITFTDWDGMALSYQYIGLKNYFSIFTDSAFLSSLRITFVYALAVIIFANLIGMVLAFLLTSGFKGQSVYRTGFFSPNIVGGVIMGYIWNYTFSFALPLIGKALHIELISKSWLTDPRKALWALIIVTVWQLSGYLMIIYISGITTISQDLIEAAKIDGAGGLQTIRYIKLPLIRNSMTICLFLAISRAFMAFDVNLTLTAGGPFKSTELISLKIYQTAFENMKYGVGQAQAIVLFVIVAVISIAQVAFTRKGEVEA